MFFNSRQVSCILLVSQQHSSTFKRLQNTAFLRITILFIGRKSVRLSWQIFTGLLNSNLKDCGKRENRVTGT